MLESLKLPKSDKRRQQSRNSRLPINIAAGTGCALSLPQSALKILGDLSMPILGNGSSDNVSAKVVRRCTANDSPVSQFAGLATTAAASSGHYRLQK
ncbi:uncharacterized protein SPSK_08161 [Sporothrix schenckii 1099-18]|uniref:Uncharacterized protein n=1 Tax=Sporothrix schenckii 1099-18 TaxID=1397361 RepID=A0A0F2MFZ1_SPOSC|nr:uncharacterized protein SPSK_08161 [Sporothrix schenckii 1099-18]KJR87780.1 hypothetical protein SPSK_08161 [Sporothrix schenckii 1099-18]